MKLTLWCDNQVIRLIYDAMRNTFKVKSTIYLIFTSDSWIIREYESAGSGIIGSIEIELAGNELFSNSQV